MKSTRSVITRWQAARGYPKTGYLNAMQHKALLSEIVATRVISDDTSDDARAAAAGAAVVAAVALAAAAAARPISSA